MFIKNHTFWFLDFQCTMPKLSGKTLSYQADGFTIILGSRQTVDHCITECTRSETCWGVLYNTAQPGNQEEECFMVTQPLMVKDDSCCDVYVKTCPGETSLASKLVSYHTLVNTCTIFLSGKYLSFDCCINISVICY